MEIPQLTQDVFIRLICTIPALVLGLTIHEFAHAWVGWKLGDETPKRMGRVTLDPLAHLDPLGSLFFLISAMVGFGIGWAKPVPIQPQNMGNPRRDGMLVAIAGPISNLLQMPFWLLGLFVFTKVAAPQGWLDGGAMLPEMVQMVLVQGVVINIMLAAFNMLPIPPLDGHWVVQAIGGEPVERFFDSIRPYSFIILIGLLNFTPLIQNTLSPVYQQAGLLVYQVLMAAGG